MSNSPLLNKYGTGPDASELDTQGPGAIIPRLAAFGSEKTYSSDNRYNPFATVDRDGNIIPSDNDDKKHVKFSIDPDTKDVTTTLQPVYNSGYDLVPESTLGTGPIVNRLDRANDPIKSYNPSDKYNPVGIDDQGRTITDDEDDNKHYNTNGTLKFDTKYDTQGDNTNVSIGTYNNLTDKFYTQELRYNPLDDDDDRKHVKGEEGSFSIPYATKHDPAGTEDLPPATNTAARDPIKSREYRFDSHSENKYTTALKKNSSRVSSNQISIDDVVEQSTIPATSELSTSTPRRGLSPRTNINPALLSSSPTVNTTKSIPRPKPKPRPTPTKPNLSKPGFKPRSGRIGTL